MSNYFFQLGSTPALSLLELAYLSPHKPTLIVPNMALINLDSLQEAKNILQIAGGLIKTGFIINEFDHPSQQIIDDFIISYLQKTNFKVTFSISAFGNHPTYEKDFSTIKNKLKQKNLHVRYIKPVKQGLSASVLLHKQVIELVIIFTNDKAYLGRTIAVQDIDQWTIRDRNKPYADGKKGMIPPKLARVMINICREIYLQHHQPTNVKRNLKLYDPFCGTGTVIAEGLMRGLDVIGADIDNNAVDGSKKNIDWLINEYHLQNLTVNIIKRDATQENPTLDQKIELIVTEPFLGKPNSKTKNLKNIFLGLYRTYLGAFKNWRKNLKPGAALVVIFPRVEINGLFNLKKLIDKLPALGYTIVSHPIIYSRPGSTIKREIHFLRYKE